MFFNTLDFAVFFVVVFFLYYLVSNNLRQRNVLLLASSYFFYACWDWRFLFLIIISSTIDFIVGKKLHEVVEPRKRKWLLIISLFFNLGFLLYFKYANFFIDTFADAFTLFGRQLEVSTLNIILPVGISFYTFQTLSYTIDIYRKQLTPTKDWLAFFSFVAFFPQLVAGPIERASHLLPQFYKTYKFNYDQVKSGLLLMAFGLFKKMVIADRAAIAVNQVYNNPADYSGFETVLATILFAFQIYCDFSGYSDIAIGASRTMGFDLMKNFNSPYFSKSITEFWRRWHISLSTWFRDYVYIPLGGNRKGKLRTDFNLLMVFTISGLWHGAAMTFVVWGFIHGIIIVIEKRLTKTRNKAYRILPRFLNYIISILTTFIIVCFAWIFFRANSIHDAFLIINNSFKISTQSIFDLGLGVYELTLLFSMILLLLVFELFHLKYNASKIIKILPLPLRWIFYMTIVFIISVFGIYGQDQVLEFIYFQF